MEEQRRLSSIGATEQTPMVAKPNDGFFLPDNWSLVGAGQGLFALFIYRIECCIYLSIFEPVAPPVAEWLRSLACLPIWNLHQSPASLVSTQFPQVPGSSRGQFFFFFCNHQ
jgi:hypothetical protein